MDDKPKFFLMKKCVLAGMMLLFIFFSLNVFIVTHAFSESHHKTTVDLCTFFVFVIEVLVLYGVVHNNIYAALVMALATGLLTFVTGVQAYHLILPWTIVLIVLTINAIAVSFIYDLWQLRKAEANKNQVQDVNTYQRFNGAV